MSASGRNIPRLAEPRRIMACAMACMALTAGGHESPSQIIDSLTLKMADSSVDPGLMYRRALEYRAVGKMDQAADDLDRALKLAPDHLPALVEASRVAHARGHFNTALGLINRALALVPDERQRAPLQFTRALIHESLGNLSAALDDCDSAIRQSRRTADWYLARNRIEARLGLHERRMLGLQRGFEQTQSAVLEIAWIDAMLDAGQWRAALERIEPKLARSRWQSSWLIRRARALHGVGEADRARADLQRALAEIDDRLRPERADPLLQQDRDLAQALLDSAAGAGGPASRQNETRAE